MAFDHGRSFISRFDKVELRMRKQIGLAAVVLGSVALMAGSAMAAPITAFANGSFQGNFGATSDVSVSSTVQHNGNNTLELAPTSGWEQLGIYGGNTTIPGDATTLDFSFYVAPQAASGDPAPSQPIVAFIVQSSLAPNYPAANFTNGNSSQFTIDGQAGSTVISSGVWHNVSLDLQAAFMSQQGLDLSQGTTPLFGIFVQQLGNTSAQPKTYLDDVKLVSVPEPAALGALGVVGLLGLKRKRKSV